MQILIHNSILRIQNLSGVLVALFLTSSILAQPQNSNPILKIEPGMHTDKIWKISVDAKEKFLVSASEDTTIRVWEIGWKGKLKLERVIRPPVEEGDIGKLYSVAISPDGNWIAAGNGAEMVYIFNRTTGKMNQVIQNDITPTKPLPDEVTTPENVAKDKRVFQLKFSADNQYLAVNIGIKKGLSIYRKDEKNNFTRIGSDLEYNGISRSSDFFFQDNEKESTKILATASEDGFIRLYSLKDNTLSLPVKIKTKEENGKPVSIQFSPNGKDFVIGYDAKGYQSSNKVEVYSVTLDPTKLSAEYSFSPTMKEFVGDISTACYSKENLYAMSDKSKDSISYIRKWESRGKGKYTDVTAAKKAIFDCKPAIDGGIFFAATEEFGIGKLDLSGKRDYLQLPPLGNTQFIGKRLFVSKDGSMFQFDIEKGSPFIFDFKTKELKPAITIHPSLSSPLLKTEGIDLKDWVNSKSPSLNGKKLALDDKEIARAMVINPNKREFLLKSNLFLRYYDKDGALLWKKEMPIAVNGMNISGNGRLILLTHRDTALRWYRTSDGQELLTFFPLHEKKERKKYEVYTTKKWIAWTSQPSEGYYDTVIGGEELLGWQFNKGRVQSANFFPVSSFRKDYYRPDIIREIFSSLDVTKAIETANQKYSRTETSVNIANAEPPTIEFTPDKFSSNERTVTVQIAIQNPSGKAIKRIISFVNDAKVTREFKPDERIPDSIPIELNRVGENKIQFVVENENSTATSDVRKVYFNGEKQIKKPNLFLFAVGISKYVSKQLNSLTYADKDANDFISLMKNQAGKTFDKVIVDTLILNEKATRADVLKQLEAFHAKPTEEKPTVNDITMIFLSGHGGSEGSYYYFLPTDIDMNKKATTGIESNDLVKNLFNFDGKVILVVDACFSGSLEKDITLLGNLSKEKRVVLLSSSNSLETSAESKRWENGAMTYAIKNGIKEGKAADPNTNIVNLRYLGVWLKSNVEFLTNKMQKPTILIPNDLEDLEIAIPEKK
jgi:WD40 repeat protein